MGLQKNAVEEGIKYFQRMPLGIRLMKYPLNIARILVKGISGAYFERPPLRYSIYPDQSLSTRRDFVANNPSFKWQA